jgi:hypothetical protein
MQLTFSTFDSLLTCSNPINREEVMIIGTQCTSERTLNADSDLDWRRSRKILLTEYGAESGDRHNTKVIENFYTFPESINTPSYHQRFRCYDLCNLGCCWKFPVFWTDQLSGWMWTLSLLPLNNWKSPKYKGPREFYNLSYKGWNSGFEFRTKKLWPIEVDRTYKIRFFNSNWFQVPFDSHFRWIEWFSKIILFMHMHMQNYDICRSYTFLTKIKICPIYKAYV